jgi:hypothetical protein
MNKLLISIKIENKSIIKNHDIKINELNIFLYKNISIYRNLVQIINNDEINFYNILLTDLNIHYNRLIQIFRNYKEDIYPLEYLDLEKILIISFNRSFSNYKYRFIKINNSQIIKIISNKFTRSFNYFLQTLIINILSINGNIFIRGGFLRDLFIKKNNFNIDLDIYIDYDFYDRILNIFYDFINRHSKQLYNIFYLLVSELSKFILGEEIKLKEIYTYNNLTQDTDKKCLKMVFEKYQNIEISLDINYNYPHQYHNSKKVISNFDFIMNALELFIDNNNVELRLTTSCMNEYTTKKLENINLIDNDNIDINIITNINSYIDYTTKVINMIIKKKTFLCHNICTDDTCCDYQNCKICENINKKIYRRYQKFNTIFEIELERCNKKYCILDSLLKYIELNNIELDNGIDNEKKIIKTYNNNMLYSRYTHYSLINT